MHPQNQKKLEARVIKAAEAALAAQGYASAVDVLVGMSWLDADNVKRWRAGQVDYLERVVQANLSRISAAMKLFRSWAAKKGLRPSESAYVARSRRPLRFSKSGNSGIERLYRTHWVSPQLSERKRERSKRATTGTLDPMVVQPSEATATAEKLHSDPN
jgi:hypothetical protein